MTGGKIMLLWAPRLLLILFALFLIVFSFDVFQEGKSATQIGIAFLLHNVPSMILGFTVYLAWRREWIGSVACVVLAVAWIAWAWGQFPLVTYIAIAGPPFLIAALYAVNWRIRAGAEPRS